ncbi:hypothetical protein LOAG_03267 [Loa loa]|uniref:Uncharacterized protein n=1 Tax=Loa loa TaxID=7209 RepID=A0A1S0U6M1_LOALO|nr:hypothetical protein LOAG_03267 [Loa loa]EFO25217.1 hypothetical protein LOAG_03267 [Loa loa]
MMGCECVSPPPEFDIPPPPDPTLIWHLLSDELADELTQIQQCDADQKATSHDEVSFVFSSLPDYLLYALLASGALISAALLVVIIFIQIRRLAIISQLKIADTFLAYIIKTIDLSGSLEIQVIWCLALALLPSFVLICIPSSTKFGQLVESDSLPPACHINKSHLHAPVCYCCLGYPYILPAPIHMFLHLWE